MTFGQLQKMQSRPVHDVPEPVERIGDAKRLSDEAIRATERAVAAGKAASDAEGIPAVKGSKSGTDHERLKGIEAAAAAAGPEDGKPRRGGRPKKVREPAEPGTGENGEGAKPGAGQSGGAA